MASVKSSKRRELIKGGLAMAAIGGSGTVPALVGGRSARAAETLRVTHFGGPYAALDQLVAAPFAEAGLGNVVYLQETTASASAKLQSERDDPSFDICMMSRSGSLRAAKAGLLARLDLDRIPETANVYPDALLDGDAGLAYLVDTIEFIYDSEQAGDIETWLDLWRPEFAGKIALPASTVALPLYILPMVARALGGHETDPAAIDEAFERLIALKPAVRTFVTDPIQTTTLIERGEIAIAPHYGIRMAPSLLQYPNLRRGTPKEGAVGSPYDLCIAANSPSVELAHAYLDFVVAKEQQDRLAAEMLATTVNRDLTLPPERVELVMTDFASLAFIDEELLAERRTDWLERWRRDVQS